LRILYFSHLYDPEPGAQPVRVRQLAQQWARRGHDVTILTGFPNHPEGRIFPAYRRRFWKFVDTSLDGDVRVVRTWLIPRANNSAVNRLIAFSTFTGSSALTSLGIGRADVVIGTVPQPLSPLAAWLKSRLGGAAFLLEIRDLWPEGLLATGQASTDSMSYRFLDHVAGFLNKRADHIVAVTDAIRDHLVEQRGVPDTRVDVVRAGVASEAFQSVVEPEESKRKWDAEGRFVVSYVGTHGNAHDLWSILRAAEKISTINPDVLFFFAGQGAEATQLRDHASSLGLTNVKFLGGIDRREIPSLLNASDICLATLRDSPIFRTVVPTKLYEYMAAGRPIICNVPGEATEMLERAGTGVYVPAADPDALVGAIKMLIADPERRFAMGRAGREAVRKDASWESRADDYLEILKRIVDRNRG
jgi:colanic acid biosynthesis glycosyl transferase WcaI